LWYFTHELREVAVPPGDSLFKGTAKAAVGIDLIMIEGLRLSTTDLIVAKKS
jgi:hypothetical protein